MHHMPSALETGKFIEIQMVVEVGSMETLVAGTDLLYVKGDCSQGTLLGRHTPAIRAGLFSGA